MSTFNNISHSQMESTASFSSSQMTASESTTWTSSQTIGDSSLKLYGNPIEHSPISPQSIENGNVSPTVQTFSDTIPPDNINRTLVLCFDGTGDQFDDDNSNIVQFFSMLKKDDPNKQLVYYQAGIGTYTTPEIATPFASRISKSLDMAIAWNLDAHIMGGYEFLMQNYRTGDKICIFGFSRGAYTARCLAGMIHKVGLLPTCNHQQVPFAYKMYTQADDEGWKQSNAFKKSFAIDVDIEFLGVWDTVASVGLIPRRLPFTTSNSVVKTFRHALALDERRAKFKANHWNRPTPAEEKLSISDREKRAKAKKEARERGQLASGKHAQEHSKNSNKSNKSAMQLERKHSKDRVYETDVLEVWFAGCHCDIGGGSVGNGVKPNLARIPLRWMIRECFKTKSGILFHIDGLLGVNLDPACLYPEVRPRPPALPLDTFVPEMSCIQPIPKNVPKDTDDDDDDEALLITALTETEEEADLKDVLAPVYDQLSLNWNWWVLELVPMKLRFQVKEKQTGDKWDWQEQLQCNFGRGRHIPRQRKDGVKIHRTVKTRMEAAYTNGEKYKPATKNLKLEHVVWVD